MNDLQTEARIARAMEEQLFTIADVEEARHDGYQQGVRRTRAIARRGEREHFAEVVLAIAAGVVIGFVWARSSLAATAEASGAGVPVEARAEASWAAASPDAGVGASSPAVGSHPALAGPISESTPAITPSAELGTAIEAGIAAWADPSFGSRYLALPDGPGIRVSICSQADSARCVDRVSTDAGPDLAMQRAGRIADVSYVDFAWLCGCDPRVEGTMPVTIEYLGADVTPPTTDGAP